MGAIINASINVAAMPKEKFVKKGDGQVWYNFQISINDETRFGNNCWITDRQSKEEREAKVRRLSLGNASVVWIDDGNGKGVTKEGTIQLAVKDQKNNMKQTASSISSKSDDLPF